MSEYERIYICKLRVKYEDGEICKITISPFTGEEKDLFAGIVRCKDCEYYELDPDPIDPGWPMRCADCGRDMLEPDGYCAWGKRRDALETPE